MFDVLSPLRGIQAVLYGLKKLRHPRLRMLGLLPIGINALVYAGILWFAVNWADDVVGVLASWLRFRCENPLQNLSDTRAERFKNRCQKCIVF